MALSAIAVSVAASRLALPHLPPLAHTGGFGEPTCRACHFDNPLNAPAGGLIVTGLPDRFAADSTYTLTVRLSRFAMARAGFELAVRNASGADSGRQAGRLQSTDNRSDVSDTAHSTYGPVQYARQSQTGSRLQFRNSARWTVKWTAPARPAGAVVLHVAANAANDDASEFSDYVYTAVRAVAPK